MYEIEFLCMFVDGNRSHQAHWVMDLNDKKKMKNTKWQESKELSWGIKCLNSKYGDDIWLTWT